MAIKPTQMRTCETCGYEVDVAVVYHVCIKPKVVERPADAPVPGRRHSYPSASHGTRPCYQNGCRRPECVAANYAYLKTHRKQRKAAGLRSRYDRWDPA